MSDAASTTPDPIEAPDPEGSTHAGDVPTNPIMAALHRAASEDSGRRRNWLLGIADDTGRRSGERDEVAELRERLAAAEKRAEEAESALPHLMELGQKTVDGLLNDARRRGREIIEASRLRAEEEFAATRDEVRKEARELDALRMAVAAEAMGLEQIRAELQRRISSSAAELTRMAEHPRLLGGQLPVEELGLAAPRQHELPAPADPAVPTHEHATQVFTPDAVVEAATAPSTSIEAQIEIAGAAEATLDVSGSGPSAEVAVVEPIGTDADAPAPPADPHSPFAAAWAAEEDDGVAEAFDRFFSADVDYEPSREWILADDTRE